MQIPRGHKAAVGPSAASPAQAILACFDEGREPLNTEIAEAVGVSVNSLGMYLKPTGIKAKPTGRSGIKGRYFTFDLRAKLEDVLKGRRGGL